MKSSGYRPSGLLALLMISRMLMNKFCITIHKGSVIYALPSLELFNCIKLSENSFMLSSTDVQF